MHPQGEKKKKFPSINLKAARPHFWLTGSVSVKSRQKKERKKSVAAAVGGAAVFWQAESLQRDRSSTSKTRPGAFWDSPLPCQFKKGLRESRVCVEGRKKRKEKSMKKTCRGRRQLSQSGGRKGRKTNRKTGAAICFHLISRSTLISEPVPLGVDG